MVFHKLHRDGTRVSCVSCIGRQVPYHSTTWEAHRTMRFPGMGLMTHRTRGSTLGSVTPIRAESRVSRRHPHTPALTADGATHVSISRCMGKGNAVSSHGRILARLQEERDPDTWGQTQCEWTLRTLC